MKDRKTFLTNLKEAELIKLPSPICDLNFQQIIENQEHNTHTKRMLISIEQLYNSSHNYTNMYKTEQNLNKLYIR